MSKYDKLRDFLNKQTNSSQKMTFSEIEEILGIPLPISAYKYQQWWGNAPIPSRQSHAWVSIGWETEGIDLAGKKVTFRQAKNS